MKNIYKRDTKGNLRIWFMEQDGERYRTTSGLANGKQVTTEWTRAYPTNIGRANERDAFAQAAFEVEAAYAKKLSREYHDTIEATEGGAHYFKPMLAAKYEKFEAGYAQPKLDGIRCIATKAGLFSREGKPILGAPHIHEALVGAFEAHPDLILDGELYNHQYKDDFNEIVSMVKKANPSPERLAEIKTKVEYHVYDIPSLAKDFGKRFAALLVVVHALNEPSIKLVDTRSIENAEQFDHLHVSWLEAGYEGSMWRADKPYEQKRSKTLLKRKEFQDAEYEVVSIEEGQGNWSGMAKRVVCKLPDGREFGAGIKGDMKRAKTLLGEKHNVVTVQFFALTPDGIPRFPVATKFHGEARTL